MRPNKNILRYALVLVAALMFAGLGGWYFFLNQQAQTITATDASRGLGTSDSPRKSAIGNTYDNIVSGISSFVNGTSTSETGGGAVPPQLWKVTKTPVAGAAFSGSGTSTRVFFAESSTGYILSADPGSGAITRLTNKLFPKTYEAVFAQGGSVVLRSIDAMGGVASFAGILSRVGTTTSEAKAGDIAFAGKNLERDIQSIVPAPYTRELLYIKKNPSGGVEGSRSSWDGTKQKNIFSSPLSGWNLISLSDGSTFFALRPADNAPGFAYKLESDGSLTPVVGNVPGLTFLPNTSSTAILYGASENGSLALFARVRGDATAFSLPIRTVADKCVWSTEESPAAVQSTTTPKIFGKKPNPAVKPLVAYCAVPQFVTSNTFLNDWYKGTIHTSDSWWRVDVSAGTVELLLAPSPNESIDVMDPTMDDGGKYIAFMNARDKTLWLLRISSTPDSQPKNSQ